MTIGESQQVKRVEIELFKDKVPLTAENFRSLCCGFKTNDRTLHYKGSLIHKITKDFLIQGGDIEKSNGFGGESIYGKTFNDENFYYSHSARYVVSMANSGPNTNNSQFFILLKSSPNLDGKNVVFGKVVKGKEVIDLLESLETGLEGVPKEKIQIQNSGEILEK